MVGREGETAILEECIRSSRPEFVALYGRRRVGKTYLIREFFDNSFSFYFTGVQNVNTRQQLRIFKEALNKYGDDSASVPKDWYEAFSRLERLLDSENVVREYRTGRRVVFLDEMPWMDTARSNFKSALDYFWNSWGSAQKDLVLIICGSATSWIINNIVKDSGGFYNRLTRQIRLMPFNLSECEQLLDLNGVHMTRKQIVECYMVFGGVPYYLNYLKPNYSLAQNIDMLFFKESSPLKYEFTQLFKSLFKNADSYITLIRHMYNKKGGITRSQILEAGNTVTGKELTTCLENLEQCGFIRKYYDFTRKTNGAYFQLIDSLCLFYLTFIESGKVDSWLDYIATPSYYSWCGLTFENVCLQHTMQIKSALGISGVSTHEFAWRSKAASKGAQIDLIIDRKDDVINICEIKYSTEPYVIDADYERELNHKIETFRTETGTKKALWLTMISFSGIADNKYKNTVQVMLTGDDLWKS